MLKALQVTVNEAELFQKVNPFIYHLALFIVWKNYKKPMVLIEVQTGSYLGEDDIVRYEDLYAR